MHVGNHPLFQVVVVCVVHIAVALFVNRKSY